MDAYGFTYKGYTRETVVAKTTAYSLLENDSGKVFTNAGASASVTFSLPTVGAAFGTGTDGLVGTGAVYTIVKLTDDNVVIDAAAGDYIADSSSGGQIQNTTASETYASITLISVSTTQWAIAPGAVGTWTTV